MICAIIFVLTQLNLFSVIDFIIENIKMIKYIGFKNYYNMICGD